MSHIQYSTTFSMTISINKVRQMPGWNLIFSWAMGGYQLTRVAFQLIRSSKSILF